LVRLGLESGLVTCKVGALLPLLLSFIFLSVYWFFKEVFALVFHACIYCTSIRLTSCVYSFCIALLPYYSTAFLLLIDLHFWHCSFSGFADLLGWSCLIILS
jgi:hypothetical protein